MDRTAIVIGSGIAGIATAIRLQSKGYQTAIYEANDYPGGKLHAFSKDGFRFDYGPSLFTMPNLVDELFTLAGKNPKDYFDYSRMEVVCNYFWEDGTRFTVTSKESEFINKAAQTFSESPESIAKYLESNQRKYELTAPLFLERSLHKMKSYLSVDTLKALAQLYRFDLLNTLNGVNEQHFTNPKLVQLFNRYATYNGSSPYLTPGIMSMIPHLEMYYGTFLPKEGMHQITTSLVKLAEDIGINFHYHSKVDKINVEKGDAKGVQVNGELINADIVVSNMDIYSTYRNLIPEQVKRPEKVLSQQRSSSALIFYWGINRNFDELDLHNIFFSEDYRAEFEGIFDGEKVTDDPTVYVNITSKYVSSDAPENCENWFVMINVPGNTGQDWAELTQSIRKNTVNKISRVLNVDLRKHIVTEEVLDPVRIENDTSSHQGSLYGNASNTKMAAFLRHANFSSKLKNLYFCGGSVHPGGGIPLCLLSAKITSDLIPD